MNALQFGNGRRFAGLCTLFLIASPAAAKAQASSPPKDEPLPAYIRAHVSYSQFIYTGEAGLLMSEIDAGTVDPLAVLRHFWGELPLPAKARYHASCSREAGGAFAVFTFGYGRPSGASDVTSTAYLKSEAGRAWSDAVAFYRGKGFRYEAAKSLFSASNERTGDRLQIFVEHMPWPWMRNSGSRVDSPGCATLPSGPTLILDLR